MIKLTEKHIQYLGFDYDSHDEEYSLWCAKNVYVNATFLPCGDFFITIQVHQATALLSHIKTEYQLDKLLNSLSEIKPTK